MVDPLASADEPRDGPREGPTPHREILRRRDDRARQVRELGRASLRFATARGAVFVAALLVLWGVLGPGIDALWLLAPATAFVALVVAHQRARHAADQARRAVRFHERGLARLEGTWPGSGPDGSAWLDHAHPYAVDLDVLGPGSLFQLLCLARTRFGQERLASWLLHPASPTEISARQAAVRELAPRLDERERLALLGHEGVIEIEPDRIVRWGEVTRTSNTILPRAVAALLSAALVICLAGWLALGWSGWPLILTTALAYTWSVTQKRTVERALADVDASARELATLARLLALLEKGTFECERLRSLQASLARPKGLPSRRVRALGRLVDRLDWARNPFFAPLGAVLLWRTQVGLAIEAWRQVSGRELSTWTSALADYESMHSLASHAFEHPGDVFADLLDGDPHFAAEGLAHPLLPEGRAVRNDIDLGSSRRLFIVSGSNMSGKSTLLRAIGCNAVLAQAGAPVRATKLSLTALAVGGSIRVQDSLLDGASRFRAELTRLRTVLELTEGPLPVLFLLDEIFHGTHSHDRRQGSEAFVRRLVDRGAMGLVTTHDLALARMTEVLGEIAANVHFEDHMEPAGMTFDYRLRPGVVEKSNALALMRAEGLID
jgi:hypothetical protein